MSNQNISSSFNNADLTAIIARIQHALTFIDAADRDTWIKCGMAIKSEVGELGFDAWDMWSATADNYQARATVASWRSFKDGGGIKIGTLFKLAMEKGYIHNTTDKPIPMTPEQITDRKAKRKAAEDKTAQLRADVATKAQAIWNATPNAQEAGYHSAIEHGC